MGPSIRVFRQLHQKQTFYPLFVLQAQPPRNSPKNRSQMITIWEGLAKGTHLRRLGVGNIWEGLAPKQQFWWIWPFVIYKKTTLNRLAGRQLRKSIAGYTNFPRNNCSLRTWTFTHLQTIQLFTINFVLSLKHQPYIPQTPLETLPKSRRAGRGLGNFRNDKKIVKKLFHEFVIQTNEQMTTIVCHLCQVKQRVERYPETRRQSEYGICISIRIVRNTYKYIIWGIQKCNRSVAAACYDRQRQ